MAQALALSIRAASISTGVSQAPGTHVYVAFFPYPANIQFYRQLAVDFSFMANVGFEQGEDGVN